MNIENSKLNKILTGSSADDSITNSGALVKIYAKSGNDTIDNSANLVTISSGAGDDSINNTGSDIRVSLDAGNDYFYSYGGYSNSITNMKIYGGAGTDTIYSYYSGHTTLSGDAGDDYIYSYTSYSENGNNSISGGAGNDTIELYNYASSSCTETIVGGKGDDIVSLGGYYNKNFIQYTYGDGDDTIVNLGAQDTLQIRTTKKFSTIPGGSDIYILFDKGSITLKDTSNPNIVTVKGGNSGGTETKKWRLSGTTAKYGTTSKTLATVKGAKSTSGLGTPNGKKISLASSALNKKVTVSGSYEFDFASGYKNATISGTAKADSITARGSNIKIIGGKGNDSIKMIGSGQTISGGTGADVFVYAASGGKEKITDFSSNDKLKIGASGTENYSTVRSGDDIVVNVDEGGKITLVGAADLSSVNIVGTKQTSGQGVKVSNNGKKITLTENYNDSSFSLSGKYSSAVTLDASDALLDLSIIGNAYANKITGSSQDDTIDGGAGRDTIRGGEGNDSLFGGKGNDILIGGDGKDTLWGGAGDDKLYGNNGKDVFYYRTGEGSDTIFGYEASVDKIMLGSGSISNVTTDRDNNVIFTVGDGQIVVNNGADSTIKIVNSSGKIVNNGLYEP